MVSTCYPKTLDQVLTDQQVLDEMGSEVNSLKSTLGFNSEMCFTLLQKFKWDKLSLLESYHATSCPQQFLVDNSIVPKVFNEVRVTECSVCCLNVPLFGFACNHPACAVCWKSYLKEKIEKGEVLIECMDSSCNLIINNETVELFLGDPILIERYQKLIINRYVEVNPNVVRCPISSCGKLLKRIRLGSSDLICPCGFSFCYSCGKASHLPASCRQLQLWEKKCATRPSSKGTSADKRSFEWILANTKDCPKCLTPIEKNGGCKHMECKNKNCRFYFCWSCLSPVHYSRPCNRSDMRAMNSRRKPRADLFRFLFYFDQFEEHRQKLKKEKKMAKHEDYEFLQEPCSLLLASRETLMHSCICRYYSKNDLKAKSLEEKQKNLKLKTDQFSIYLKEYFDRNGDKALKRMIEDVENSLKAVQDHCANGGNHLDSEAKGSYKSSILDAICHTLSTLDDGLIAILIFLLIISFMTLFVIILASIGAYLDINMR